MYFKLAKDVYAAQYGNDIVLMDAKKDRYFSLTDSTALVFKEILTNEFIEHEQTYLLAKKINEEEHKEVLCKMIPQFLERGFIEPAKDLEKVQNTLQQPLKSGGLANYQWDHKSSLALFSQVPKKTMVTALCWLYRVHRLLQKQGIKGVLNAIEQKVQINKAYIRPTQEELKMLSDCVDLACAFYLKKVFCLGWASTYVLLALERGWRCNLVIGIQTLPFYAHAWVECDGLVINDDKMVAEYLSVLIRHPFERLQ